MQRDPKTPFGRELLARPFVPLCTAVLILVLIPLATDCSNEAHAMKPTRPSALAGSWYARDPQELVTAVDAHIAHGQPLAEVARQAPIAIIAPHAGHQWSGDAAGHVYRLLEGPAGESLERVILLGPSHYQAFRGASVLDVGAYATPLGDVPLDTAVVRALLKSKGFTAADAAHLREHCLEIQLPFLQRVLHHPFRIVPILVSRLGSQGWAELAATLAPYVDPHTLILVSSDFTHYGTRFGYVPFTDDVDMNLRRLDKGALAMILRRDAPGLARYLDETDISVCGIEAIGVLLELLDRPDLQSHWGGLPPQGRVLDYYRSADLLGDFDGSVSYAAVAFFRAGDLLAGSPYPDRLQAVHVAHENPDEEASAQFTTAEQRFLLGLARQTLREVLSGRPAPQVTTFPSGVSAAKMQALSGVFVTLTQRGALRGCIGHIVGSEPLVAAVIENAISAAQRDPRFPPVTAAELASLEIEISVLTPLQAVSGPQDIVVGRHGVVLERGGRRAVFLPQVAPEQGWDRDTMLDHLALKAGLPRDAWRKGANFEVFEAFVFSEAELAGEP